MQVALLPQQLMLALLSSLVLLLRAIVAHTSAELPALLSWTQQAYLFVCLSGAIYATKFIILLTDSFRPFWRAGNPQCAHTYLTEISKTCALCEADTKKKNKKSVILKHFAIVTLRTQKHGVFHEADFLLKDIFSSNNFL